MMFFCGLLFSCVLICFVKSKNAKATTIAEALEKWEEASGLKAAEAVEVKLYGQSPPIKKMDSSLSLLKKCEKLSLLRNQIETIENLDGLKNLKMLSLIGNNLKTLEGLKTMPGIQEDARLQIATLRTTGRSWTQLEKNNFNLTNGLNASRR